MQCEKVEKGGKNNSFTDVGITKLETALGLHWVKKFPKLWINLGHLCFKYNKYDKKKQKKFATLPT